MNCVFGDEWVCFTLKLSGHMRIKCSIYRDSDDILFLMPVIKPKTK